MTSVARLARSAVALLVALAAVATAQDADGGFPGAWVGGYARDVRGEVIEYASALPEVRSALLVRSLDAGRGIAWETEPVSAGLAGERVAFVWLFGVDADPERHGFTLSVDGEPALVLSNPPDTTLEPWEVAGAHGSRLRLAPTRVDRHGDVFGFATLEVPRERVHPGRPLRLELSGESAGSRVWWMTFRAQPRPSARVVQPAAVRRDGERRWQPLALEVVHLGPPTEAAIESTFGPALRMPLALGLNRLELEHAEVREATDERVEVRVAGGPDYALPVRVEPVRPWTLHLVQHSHTDIGYTRPQTEILAEQVRYLDTALELCDATDGWPDAARFRWTCEAAWPVREFLRTRPRRQVERLFERVAEGRIEVTALFANLSELLDERSCAASLEPLSRFRFTPFSVTTAMQDDVNGLAWCYVDMLAEAGVRYVNMGQHGHRALVPFERPTAFWWESPSGRRLLAWRADHYMTGNLWSLHAGRLEAVEPELFRYLGELELAGYPWERVAVQYSGVLIDNAPPGLAANEVIRAWNERYAWPRLESSTVSALPRWIEAEHGDELEVLRAAWPDWWSDGLGSAPRELAQARRAQGRLAAVEGLLAMDALLGTPPSEAVLERVASAREQLVFYGEHTYGAAESVSDPQAANSVTQWALKQAYAWEAAKQVALAEEAALGLLQPHLERAEQPTISVVNTLSHARTGLARVYVDRELLPPGRRFRVVDDAGDEAPMQLVQRLPDGAWWGLWARDVPPLGWRTYRLELLDGEEPARTRDEALELESPTLRLRLDPASGAIASLVDKQLERELVDPDAPWPLGSLVHEALGDRHQLELFTLESCERAPADVARVERGADGPIWTSAVVHGSTPLSPGADGLRVELRLFEPAKRLELTVRVRKRPSTEPEALYLAFPFALDGGRVRFETVGALVDPERDLIPGTSSDWHAVQGFVALEDERARVLLASPDALLWQLGGLNLGRFERVARVEHPRAYAWLLNNYWVTNFLASQEGELAWSFVVTVEPAAAPASSSARFGLEEAIPLLARVQPGARAVPARGPTSVLELSAPNVVLVGARPDGRGMLLHLREVEGRPATVFATNPRTHGARRPLRRVDLYGRTLGSSPEALFEAPAASSGGIELRPFESAFARL